MVSVNRLKPAHIDPDKPLKVAQPRPRGRPRAVRPQKPTLLSVPIEPVESVRPTVTRYGRVSNPTRQMTTGVTVSEGGLCSDPTQMDRDGSPQCYMVETLT